MSNISALLVLVALCLLVIACDILVLAYRRSFRPRVIYGEDDVHDDYPYVVALQHNYKNIPERLCTGSLINEKWVLTASHCLTVDDLKVTLVRYGNMTLPWNITKLYSKVLKTVMYPSYQDIETFDVTRNDIALLLVQNIPIRLYGRLSAIDYKTLTGLRARYAGFGLTFPVGTENYTEENEKLEFTPLQIGDAVVLKCDNKPQYKMGGPFMCIGPPCSNKRHSTLGGDSGGPLFVDNQIVGVLYGSYDNLIAEYTPVSPYLDWIKDVTSSTS